MRPEHLSRLRRVVFLAALAPALWLAWALFADRLGANPFEALTRRSGEWALRFLLLTLLMTPLRDWTGWRWPPRLRRMLGLYAFFYAALHLLTWLWFDQFFDWAAIGEDIVKRPFITAGMGALQILLVLAATSPRAMMRRLGRRWKPLHRAVYAAVPLAVLHHFWLVKADLFWPAVYGALAGLLLAHRLWRRYGPWPTAGSLGQAPVRRGP